MLFFIPHYEYINIHTCTYLCIIDAKSHYYSSNVKYLQEMSLSACRAQMIVSLHTITWGCFLFVASSVGCGYNNSCQSNKNFSPVSLEGFLFFCWWELLHCLCLILQSTIYYWYGYEFSFIRERICMQISWNLFKWILKFWNLFLCIRVVSGFQFLPPNFNIAIIILKTILHS